MIKIFFFFLFLFFFNACSYPDIDTVPNFKELDLNKEELFDLCQLITTDKSEIENCIKEKQKK